MRSRWEAGVHFLACLAFLAASLAAHDLLFRLGVEHYLRQAFRPDRHGQLGPCEMNGLMEQLGLVQAGRVLAAGPCDVVLVNGMVALGGFLAFLACYFLYGAATWLVIRALPAGCRQRALVLASVAFLLLALPARPALWLLEFGLAACVVAAAPGLRRLAPALLPLLLVGLYLGAGPTILQATSEGFLSVHRLPDVLPQASVLRDGLAFLNLGTLGGALQEGDGFPFLLPALGLLVTLFRRVAWVSYDLWVGRTERADPGSLFLYLLGLPFLIGNAASPSYEEFRRRPAPEAATRQGWETLACCMGMGALGYTLLVGFGYSPLGRLLFPLCRLEQVSPAWIWGRLLLSLVLAWLFLVATEQVSVGMCRLFGHSVRDNYDRPLLARNVADFWRRWNILWREFLLGVFFLPLALALGRTRGGPRRWHLVVAVAVTFLGTWGLNVLPLLLIRTGAGGVAWTGAPPQADTLAVTAVLPALALYYALEGAAVAVNLCAAASPRPTGPMPRCLSVVATLLFLSLVRVFADPTTSMADKVDLVSRALGWP